MAATFAHSHWYCSFAGEKIILPVEDPEKRLLLYVSAVTVKHVEDANGKKCKDISLVGIGFSQPFSVKTCKVRAECGVTPSSMQSALRRSRRKAGK